MKHWTEDQFLEWLYTSDEDAPHLRECVECRARAGRMAETRRTARSAADVPWDFLAAQRRSIYRRMEQGSGMAKRWVVALASLICIIAASLSLVQPWKASDAALYTSSDAKLFSDLARIEQSSEPRAIKPIHNLFQQ